MVMREEPRAIAIIGMGCKFPGADSLEEYWQLLDDGRSMAEQPPAGRFPTHDHPRSTDKTVFWGNFVRDIEYFDHRFFKKSSREAASMDPQQRLLLEVAYHALESSGYFGPHKQQETDVGCFISVSNFFGFTGPSVSLDTACSSSAVAIDSACKSILHGDCTTAIAGGVSLFTSPHFYQNLTAASFLSSTGATKSFDAGADGYCRGEGIGLIVLKEHSRAVAGGDPILATILSTAIRQSSNQVPITVPYSPSQTALYRKVLRMAGVTPEEVTYLEAHGTGTPIGDPQEFLGIREVFVVEGRRDPLYFASVKGNIGHTEGASGASFTTLNPKIALTPGQLEIPTRTHRVDGPHPHRMYQQRVYKDRSYPPDLQKCTFATAGSTRCQISVVRVQGSTIDVADCLEMHNRLRLGRTGKMNATSVPENIAQKRRPTRKGRVARKKPRYLLESEQCGKAGSNVAGPKEPACYGFEGLSSRK
ncbi:thiolase-like protein [Aspergillus caelatus]|uniref:Thiolase-like protein n=1 Tax=Aspergillus caelatus TaxID=61420 RepID=A0A5N7AKW3_9EURO|nr:thiolase-like protein [Aspergillus caelatus]KAE8370455.1 thiolase-like protein [Aspergillus caelatus]